MNLMGQACEPIAISEKKQKEASSEMFFEMLLIGLLPRFYINLMKMS